MKSKNYDQSRYADFKSNYLSFLEGLLNDRMEYWNSQYPDRNVGKVVVRDYMNKLNQKYIDKWSEKRAAMKRVLKEMKAKKKMKKKKQK